MTVVLLNPTTLNPEPSPEAVRRLRQVDERLGMKWMEHTPCWALTVRWRENDPRRETIQKGLTQIGEDYDIGCLFAPDVRPDDIPALAERSMRNHPNTHLRQIAAEIAEYNRAQSDRNLAPVAEQLMEKAEVTVKHRSVMTVYQGTDLTLMKPSTPTKQEREEMRERLNEDV